MAKPPQNSRVEPMVYIWPMIKSIIKYVIKQDKAKKDKK